MKPTVSFETFGCSANHADTALMRHHAESAGLPVVHEAGAVVVLNTCTVKGPTQTSIERRIRELEALGKTVIVAGCLSQANPNHRLFKDKSLIGTDNLEDLPLAISGALDGQPLKSIKRKRSPLPLVSSSERPDKPFILSISQGCLSSCSFCMTKLARGNLRSHPVRHLRDITEQAVNRGHKEIYLTSQDTSAYGFDIGVNLVDLLESLLEIPGDFRIRIGMANPQHFPVFMNRFWRLFDSEKLYRFLHIPLQSGSDSVLTDMRREHTAEDYLNIVREGRALFPDLTICTDIICGYPTETPSDHELTLRMLSESMPDAVNISRFWPRPMTRAEKLKPLPGTVVKQRSREVTTLFRKIAEERNRSWLGWEGRILLTEMEKRKSAAAKNDLLPRFLGRNQSYKQVVLHSNEPQVLEKLSLGDYTNVCITEHSTFDIRGILIA